MAQWLKARCPVCGCEYEYAESYKPKTCSKFDCVHKYAHHPNRYRPLTEILDESRRKART